MSESKTVDGLIPVDPDRCQADVPNGYTFMTLGGVPGLIRCKNPPVVIVTEDLPGSDGKRGQMSMCASCLEQFRKQMSDMVVTIWRREM